MQPRLDARLIALARDLARQAAVEWFTTRPTLAAETPQAKDAKQRADIPLNVE